MKSIAFWIAFIISSQWILAQSVLEGKIIDNQNQAVLWVEIYLIDQENQILEVQQSDEKGEFQLEVPSETYEIQFESLGFSTESRLVSSLDFSQKQIIEMIPDPSIQLNEAVIVNRPKAISMKGDKILMDVETLGIGSGNNGLETMQLIPGISLDKDENIQFRGSSGVQIMLNGKKSMLDGAALRDFIKNLRGEDIKTIEIISQPSARYDASGTTGIINIVLKQNRQRILGGNLNAFASYGEYFKHQTGGKLFYNDSLWSVYASGNYYEGKSFNDREVNQKIQLEAGTKFLHQTNYWLPKTISKSFRTGVERVLNPKHTLSTDWQFYTSNEDDITTGMTNEWMNDELIEQVDLRKINQESSDNLTGNIFHRFESLNKKTKLETQFNYGYFKSELTGNQTNISLHQPDLELNTVQNSKYRLWNAQSDLSREFSEKWNWELGAKFSQIKMNYFNEYQSVEGNIDLIPNDLLINDFQYDENLISAYSQLNYKTETWDFLVGLRLENTNYKAHSNNNQETYEGNYTHIFPSASIGYSKDKNQFRLSYSKRISRPNYLDLNPYYSYLDAYSVEKGNPNLKPQIFHSFELNFVHNYELSFSVYGYLYQDGFIKVIDYHNAENYNLIFQDNASKGSRFGFSASIPYKIKNWWTMQLGVNAYLVHEKSEVENYQYDGNGYGYDVNMYQRFSLPKNWTITWNGFYYGKSESANGYSPEVFDMSLSVKKSFMDNRLEFTAGWNNFLKKSMYNRHSTVENVSTHWINKWETGRIFLQLNYNFGSNKEKRVKSTSLEEEENRL